MKRCSGAVAMLLLLACNHAEEAPEAAATTTDAQSVTLSPQITQQNGIVVTALQPLSSQASIAIGNAAVVDLTDLVSAASQYATASAQRAQAAAHAQASAAALQRVRVLNADNKNASDRAVEEAAATAASDEATLRAADVSASAAEAAARQRWGATLANGFVRGAPWARELTARETVLIEAAFNADATPPQQIRVATAAGHTVSARYLTASPHVDARLMKATLYYLAPAAGLPVGLVTTIHSSVPQSGGVFVPKEAVVWNGDRALVFVEDRPGHYVQRAIAAGTPVANGFLETTLRPGERVVTAGAQQLLSEQHKPEAD